MNQTPQSFHDSRDAQYDPADLARLEERIIALTSTKVEEHQRMWWFLSGLGSLVVAGFVTTATWVVTVEQKIAQRTETAVEKLVDRLSLQDQKMADKLERVQQRITEIDHDHLMDRGSIQQAQQMMESNRKILEEIRMNQQKSMGGGR